MASQVTMRVAFRVDASLDIGSGHVMRCLTLAQILRDNGADCVFISRAHRGNLNDAVRAQGFVTMELAAVETAADGEDEYRRWLGVTQRQDAMETADRLAALPSLDWLVVDHYALGAEWESALGGTYRRLLAIDDLVNRRHVASILLDQTFQRRAEEYREWVNPDCELLCGVEHVLLRPEFDAWRRPSIQRRKDGRLGRILISLGGVDKENLSKTVLQALDGLAAESGIWLDVVLGGSSPWIEDIRAVAGGMAATVEVHVNVGNMAEMLANCDLAIGAAGTSAWERCCLGVPTLMLVLAANQEEIGARLASSGVAQMLPNDAALPGELVRWVRHFAAEPDLLSAMSARAASLVAGNGATGLARKMLEAIQ